jgi:hypothetical protein
MKTFGEWMKGKRLLPGEKKLTAADRHALPRKDFAVPEKEKYPVEDEAHARNALSRVSQFGSAEEKKKVRAKVHKKFPDIGKGD